MRGDRRRQVVAAVLVGLAGGAVWLAQRAPRATAAPTPSPRDWAKQDLRVPSDAMIVKATLRHAMICNLPPSGSVVAGLLARATNGPKLNPAQATSLACALGAPSGATCAQLGECTGAGGPVGTQGTCDGSTLRVTTTHDQQPMAVACPAFGQACYFGSADAFCGDGLCDPFETYWCDGDTLVQCLSGVRVRTPCGRGMTCGRTASSKILACIGAKGNTCAKDRCEGNVRLTCVADGFGGKTERASDCGAMGLACLDAASPDGTRVVACVPPTPPGPDGCGVDVLPSCKDGKIAICGGSKRHTFSCEELGLSGTCSTAGGVIACK